jgi:4,5-DOPA dioxygenase extradiol
MELRNFYQLHQKADDTQKQPLVFIGHGSPMNALEDNAFTKSLNALGTNLLEHNRPKAVLCVSAHWLTRGTFVNIAEKPATIHDFGGFPQALFDIEYPAAGSPEFGTQAANLVTGASPTTDWGLDHGAWTVLRHVFPKADVPVFQMSIDYYKPMSYHFELAGQLDKLREKGVLIIGSGNVVHNLEMSFRRLSEGNPAPYDWAVEFDTWVKTKIEDCNWKDLADYDKQKGGMLAAPTPDHYAPLMYIMGLAKQNESIQQLYESVEYGGLSMRTFRIG